MAYVVLLAISTPRLAVVGVCESRRTVLFDSHTLWVVEHSAFVPRSLESVLEYEEALCKAHLSCKVFMAAVAFLSN